MQVCACQFEDVHVEDIKKGNLSLSPPPLFLLPLWTLCIKKRTVSLFMHSPDENDRKLFEKQKKRGKKF